MWSLRERLGLVALGCRAAELLGAPADAADAAVMARLRPLATALAAGVRQADFCKAAVAGLSGLGHGLTPSGDDCLVALVAATDSLARAGLLDPPAAEALRAAVGSAGDATTPKAREWLEAAAAGSSPWPLEEFLDAFCDPHAGPDLLREKARRLEAVGAHTGADMLAAVVLLLRSVVSQGGTAPWCLREGS